jgi:hypothetical protein
MLHRSPTFKIFSTNTSHSTHYESQEALLCVVQDFDANGSQSLLTLLGRVQKPFSSSFKCYNLKIYVVKIFEIFSSYFHTNVRPHLTVEFLNNDFFHSPSSVYMGAVFECFWKNIVKEL